MLTKKKGEYFEKNETLTPYYARYNRLSDDDRSPELPERPLRRALFIIRKNVPGSGFG